MFHNLKGYHSHLIFCEHKNFDVKISVIPNSLEKYMAFFLNKNLVFIGSISFMNSSLDKLVKNLSDEDFKYLVEEFGSENLELLKQKRAYPYEFMNSSERFNEKKLPARKYFQSSTKDDKIDDDDKISDGHISLKDYLTCQKIWNKFDIKDMGDYHDHYLKKQVMFFEKFIDMCLTFYGLDPCHYFSPPGLSWHAMLKMTGVKLEKISDIQYFKSNGIFFEVDLEYPDELHELHNDYPLAPEKLAVSSDMLSKQCKEIADKYEIKVGDAKKIIPNLGNKTKDVLHCKNLQLYLSLGMKLTKIHRVVKSKQSDWIKKYIDFNTEKRMNAANDFEKDFLKLMINSVYGKTMEN